MSKRDDKRPYHYQGPAEQLRSKLRATERVAIALRQLDQQARREVLIAALALIDDNPMLVLAAPRAA